MLPFSALFSECPQNLRIISLKLRKQIPFNAIQRNPLFFSLSLVFPGPESSRNLLFLKTVPDVVGIYDKLPNEINVARHADALMNNQ
jgi:hypothetical protein